MYDIINKRNITITNKKTGAKTVVINEKSDGSVELPNGDLVDGMPFTDTMDDGLYTTVLTLKRAQENLFKPFDPLDVEMTCDGETIKKSYVVGGDHTQLYQAFANTYEHFLNICECTKILDKFIIYNLNLTNKTDTLKQQILKALNNAEVLIGNETCKFTISSELSARLGNIAGEDFTFSNTNLRAVLTEILSVIDCRPYVEKIEMSAGNYKPIVISYIDMNKTTDHVLTTSTDFPINYDGILTNSERDNDLTDYLGHISARGYNSVIKEPVTVGPEHFKTMLEETLSTNNASAVLPFAIEEVYSLKVTPSDKIVDITVHYHDKSNLPSETTVDFNYDIEIVDRLLFSENYNLLDDNSKKSYLCLVKGSPLIGFQPLLGPVGTSGTDLEYAVKNKLQELANNGELLQYMKDNNIPDIYGSTQYLGMKIDYMVAYAKVDVRSASYSCTYIPRIDTTIELSKPGVYDIDQMRLGILDSQGTNSTDIGRHGRNLAGLVRRTGNEELALDFNIKKLNQLLPVMTRLTGGKYDGYVIWKREYAVFDMYIHCRYYLTKDFNSIAQKLGIKREKRLYNIPLESDECPIMIKKYVMVTRKDTINTETLLSANTMSAIVKTLTGEIVTDSKVRTMLMKTPEAFISYNRNNASLKSTGNNTFAIPTVNYAADVSMNFASKPLDNYSVGFSSGGYIFSIWGGGGMKMLYSPYVDLNGEAQYFDVALASSFNLSNTDENFPAAVASLPCTKTQYYNNKSNYIKAKYIKDRTQKPVFFFSLEVLPAEDAYGDIVIGAAFCSRNQIVTENVETDLKIYVGGNRKYQTGDAQVVDGATLLNTPITMAFQVISGAQSFAYLKCLITALDGQQWAIADSDKRLYLACNTGIKENESIQFYSTNINKI